MGKVNKTLRYARIREINNQVWENDVAGRLIADDINVEQKFENNIDDTFDNISSIKLSRFYFILLKIIKNLYIL